ncbi:MAG: hypothetical protein MI784_08755, partial [Cytophagales bacterium]|nr:hypothetical protein [Cytophagales bacterium]
LFAIASDGSPVFEFVDAIGNLIIGGACGIWSMKTILSREFKKYRIVITPSAEAQVEKMLYEKSPE